VYLIPLHSFDRVISAGDSNMTSSCYWAIIWACKSLLKTVYRSYQIRYASLYLQRFNRN